MGSQTQHDWAGLDLVVNKLRIGASTPGTTGTELTGSEITVLDGVTAGTATASKAVVLGASKEIATITSGTITTLTSTTVNSAALTGTTTLTMTSANASALAVGLTGATNPAFVIDSSTASQAAGLKITGAATGGTVALAAIDSGAAANVTINAKGTGTIGIGSVSTGAVTITPATTVTGAITPTGGVAAAGGFAISPRGLHTGHVTVTQTTDGNDSTPAATETYICEVYVPYNCTVTGVGIFNGSVASGNMTVKLANSSGVPVGTQSASTAIVGTDVFQLVPLGATYAAVGPATYLVLLQIDNATARFNTHIMGTFGASKKTGETYGTFTTVTAPTTFTTAVGPIATLY